MDFAPQPDATKPHTIETVSGVFVDVSAPEIDTIKIGDIAWATSRQARFAGHTLSEEVWSVAYHEIFVVDLIGRALGDDGYRNDTETREIFFNSESTLAMSMLKFVGKDQFKIAQPDVMHTMMCGLIHDASEAYLIDLPTPVKRYPAVQGPYRELESKMETAVFLALGIDKPNETEAAIVKWADALALRIEAANMLPSRGRTWGIEVPDTSITDMHLLPGPLPWRDVYELYLKTYGRLLPKARRV